jgi:N-acetylmuramoyl-L-alanine amidase
VVLDVCGRVAKSLIAVGLDARLTRVTDKFVTLTDRARLANQLGAVLFLSVHCNAADRPARGYEVWTTPGRTGADPFATHLFNAFRAAYPTTPARVDTTDGDPDKEAKFTVLTATRMPAALFELDFIHTPAGDQLFRDPKELQRMAEALAKGVRATLMA